MVSPKLSPEYLLIFFIGGMQCKYIVHSDCCPGFSLMLKFFIQSLYPWPPYHLCQDHIDSLSFSKGVRLKNDYLAKWLTAEILLRHHSFWKCPKTQFFYKIDWLNWMIMSPESEWCLVFLFSGALYEASCEAPLQEILHCCCV